MSGLLLRPYPFPVLLALRYLRSTRRDAFASFLSAVAAGGLALGVAALILALAVISGFQDALRAELLGRTPQVDLDLRRAPEKLGAQGVLESRDHRQRQDERRDPQGQPAGRHRRQEARERVPPRAAQVAQGEEDRKRIRAQQQTAHRGRSLSGHGNEVISCSAQQAKKLSAGDVCRAQLMLESPPNG